MWFSSILGRPTRSNKSSPARPSAKARRGRPRLAVEALEQRTVPAVFHALASAPDGAAGSLRAAVLEADGNGHNNTIRLEGATYNLTLANTAGQDNSGMTGDLDLTGAGHTITIVGRGAATVINANQLDRVFQVFPGVRVVFRDLTITGGLAQDDGTAGAAPGTTAALGGGILNQGGSVTLEHVLVRGNAARGANAHFGIVGGIPPGFAQNGEGGGIFSTGSLKITKHSAVMNNQATGGAPLESFGGRGSTGFRSAGGVGGVGAGAAGAFAEGGGIFVAGGRLEVNASVITANATTGGNGGTGVGGTGGTGFIGSGNPNGPGGPGFAGGPGGLGQGGTGGLGQGGGIFAAPGTEVTLTNKSTVSGNTSTGGNGNAGTGGTGGTGGNGGPGGDFFHGGVGGPGGLGGQGSGGAGGLGLDGGVFAGGKLTVKPGSTTDGNTGTNGAAGNGFPGAAGTAGMHG
jgi:hypothetical protein